MYFLKQEEALQMHAVAPYIINNTLEILSTDALALV